MGEVHEEAVNRGAIPRGDPGAGSGRSNEGNRAWSSGRGNGAIPFRQSARIDARSGVASGQQDLVGARELLAAGVRTRVGRTAGASGVHREAMGQGNGKEAGSQDMKTLVVAQQKGGVGKTDRKSVV